MITVSVDTSQVDSVLEGQIIDALLDRAQNLDPALQQIGEHFLLRGDEGFEGETDFYGAAWASLSPSTLEQKSKRGGISKILQDKGTMRVTGAYEVSGDQVEFGYNTPYVKYHQFGTSKMDARKVVPDEGLPAQDEQVIEEIMTDHFNIGGLL